jgi:hypothetical protein
MSARTRTWSPRKRDKQLSRRYPVEDIGSNGPKSGLGLGDD